MQFRIGVHDEQLLCNAAQMAISRDKLRVSLKALGCPVDDCTDEEIDAGVLKALKLLRITPKSLEESHQALMSLAAHGINVGLLMRSRSQPSGAPNPSKIGSTRTKAGW
jgi:hypothetical protein